MGERTGNLHRARRREHFLLLSALLAAGLLPPLAGCGGDGNGGSGTHSVIIFNAENNRLDAYDASTFEKRVVIPSSDDIPDYGRDINAQICFFPDGSRRFIAGEDTNQPNPRQGWGIFQLHGEAVSELSAQEIGKLTPTYQGSADNAENYGCGFLSSGAALTTDVGNQASGPGDGQLIIWFPPFDRPPAEQHYCKLDITIATAGGIWVDSQDRIYVASARVSPGIYRYSGPFPTLGTPPRAAAAAPTIPARRSPTT